MTQILAIRFVNILRVDGLWDWKAPVHLGSVDRILFGGDDYFCYCYMQISDVDRVLQALLIMLRAASVLCFGLLTATRGASFLPDQG